MLLGEPERTKADLNLRLFRIPVRIHPFFWVVAILLGIRGSENASDLLIWVIAVFLSILVHELGHAAVQRAYGFRPWITLYGFGGLASYDGGEAYSRKGSPTLRQILISLAGPGAGFLLVAVLAGALVLSGHGIDRIEGVPYVLLRVGRTEMVGSSTLTYLLNSLLYINILWGLLNLMPVYPLDGGQIAREIFLLATPRDGIRRSLILSMITAGAIGLFGLLQWQAFFMALLFGFLAYGNYRDLQAYLGRRGPW